MTLLHIALGVIFALVYRWLIPARWRAASLLIGSVVSLYWLTPASGIRYLDFILPTATLVLTVGVWWHIRPEEPLASADRRTLGLLAALVLALAEVRSLAPLLRADPTPGPDPVSAGLLLLAAGGMVALPGRLGLERRRALQGGILLIVALFIVLKTEALAAAVAGALRGWSGLPATGAATDLAWLGFSYTAFRLLHMLRDRQTGKLPALSLAETVTYVLFFPALLAGPIDRAERFVKDLRALPQETLPGNTAWLEGVERILIGLFKKFVLADSLSLLGLGPVTAGQFTSAPAGWALLYLYGFRLYFDFSGYSDLAIGLGLLLGVRLPENFNRPYLKTSLTAFWQSWHMTLSTWARLYIFSPLSRALLLRQPRPPGWAIVLACQLATMLVIGLWHGITWTLVVWGLWHGVGLFVHKQWSDRTRRAYLGLRERPRLKRLWTAGGWFLTFQYVMLGWVWFVLPDVQTATRVFLKLFGIGW